MRHTSLVKALQGRGSAFSWQPLRKCEKVLGQSPMFCCFQKHFYHTPVFISNLRCEVARYGLGKGFQLPGLLKGPYCTLDTLAHTYLIVYSNSVQSNVNGKGGSVVMGH